jgi:hypothetical protein
VVDPYRKRPSLPEAPADAKRPDLATVGFGLICAVSAGALAGSDRMKCMLLATAAGTLLIVLRRDRER